MNNKNFLYLILLALLIVSCGKEAALPTQFSEVDSQADIYPDYRDVVIPANIAPLNFQVRQPDATEFVAEVKGAKGEALLAAADETGIIQFDTLAWHQLLTDNQGSDLSVRVFAHQPSGWVASKPHTLTVAEPIDPYLSYRLIEPGFEIYRQLGLYQRNLTNWDVHTIYENNRVFEEENNHCVNCHNYQGYSTQQMLFHVRASHGGTILVQNGKARKIQIKNDSILAAGVYPSWHPKHNWVAFSTNKTGQTFHVYHDEKIEVVDEASDLLFYDADKNEVRNILRTQDDFETFPCWSPDGTMLYYCSAHLPLVGAAPDSLKAPMVVAKYDSVYYNLMRIPFDQQTQQFGQPQVVVDAQAQQKSISVPRVSPDGRYVLYTQGDYGQFHIWHKSSDLWVKDLQADSCYALTATNSPDVDSFHSWSSNGRWIVFSSRRMDGNYTRPHIAYFDKQGHAHKAFCLPQEDPRHNILLLKSYNVPELTRDAVRISAEQLRDCIYNTEPQTATYKK